MKDHRAGGAVTGSDQRPRIVAEGCARHAARVQERRRNPLAPVGAALMEKWCDEKTPCVWSPAIRTIFDVSPPRWTS